MSKKGFKRMKDYMQASDLNDDGVVNLAHRDDVLSFYSSEWFSVLTLGVIDGKEAATRIMKSALRGTRINL